MSVIGTTLTLTVKDLTDKLENTKTREIEDTVGGPSRYFLWGNATQQQALGTAQSVYFARISNSGVDRIRLIPAKQGDTVGFYDMVSKTFMSTFVGDTPTASSATASAYPFAPMNIVGNNGTIKVHRNLVDKSTIVRGDINSDTGAISTGILYRAVSDFIPILSGQSYTFSGRIRLEGDKTRYNASKPITALYDSSKNFIAGTRTLQNSYTFTIDNASASYIRVEWRGSPAGASVIDLESSQFQFQVGAYQTTYENGSGIYIDGTVETISDGEGNTATAQLLLSSSTYVDTQEVLTGAITRRTAIKVLNGTEDWYVNTGDYNFFRLNSAVSYSGNLNAGFYCTHFKPVAVASATNNQGIRLNSNSIFIRYDDLYPATTENLPLFKQWLSDQYAQGTPVIVVYPFSTAVTESVPGQELTTKPVTQTAGSISNMTITVTSDGGIPTPSTPKDIICNNGVLKGSKNLFDKDNTPILNIAIQNGKYVSNNERYGVAIKVNPSTTYTFSLTQPETRYFINIGLSDTAPAINRACTYLSAGTVDSYTLTTESTTQYVYIYTTSSNFVDTTQFELGSNATPYHKYGIYTDGNVETVKDSGNRIATAEMLLKIGDYVDTQEVLSGNITRKVGIKVFDGTETLQEYTGVGGRYRYTIALPNSPSLNGIAYCSHFVGGKTLAEINADTTITQAVGVYTSKLRFYTTTYETLSDFTTFLAEQYAKGTPVIAIYTLATETTETVTGQNLNVKSGTNKIEIVQASIDNLGISATYLSRE